MSYQDTILADSPTVAWPLQGDGLDIVGDRDLTLVGATFQTGEGLWGDWLATDGVDDYAWVAPNAQLHLPGPLTYEAWAWIPDASWGAAGQGAQIVGYNDRIGVRRFDEGENLGSSLRRNDGTDIGAASWGLSATAPKGEWVHICMVYDRAARIQYNYVNGVEAARFDNTLDDDAATNLTSRFTLGAQVDGVDSTVARRFFDGRIAWVALYDQALTAAQVSTHYDEGMATPSIAYSKIRRNNAWVDAVDEHLRRGGSWTTYAPPPASEITHGTDLQRSDVGLTSDESELTTVSGPIESTSANEVIENLHVVYSTTFGDDNSLSFAVVVKHDGVTVRNCKIEHDGPSSGIEVIDGVKNVTIEHCHFDGMSPYYGSNRIVGDPDNANQGNGAYFFAANNEGGMGRRNFITGVRGANRTRSYGVTFRENWVDYLHRNWEDVSMSSVALPYGSWGDPEYVVVERNRLIAGSSAAVTTYPYSGPIRNIRVMDNLVIGVGDGFGIRGGRAATENGNYCDNSNMKIEGNRFSGDFAFPDSLGEGTNAGVDLSRPGNTFTNNQWLPGHGTIEGDLPARCGVNQDACDGPECP